MPQNMAQPPTVQRAIMNRHHQARRSISNIAPKIEPGAIPASHSVMHSNPSPQSRQTPSSHHSSPSSNSPGFPTQGVMTPPASESQMMLQQPRVHPQPKQQLHHGLPVLATTGLGVALGSPLKGSGSSGGPAGMGGVPATYYAFQNHIEQLGKLTRPLLSYFFARALFVLD